MPLQSSIHQSLLGLNVTLIMQPDCGYFTVGGRKCCHRLFPLSYSACVPCRHTSRQAFSPIAARRHNFPWPLSSRHVPPPPNWTQGTRGGTWRWNIVPTRAPHIMESLPVTLVDKSKRTQWLDAANQFVFILWCGLLMLGLFPNSVCQNNGLNKCTDQQICIVA